MSPRFYPLRVSQTIEQIGGHAVTVGFDVPEDLADKFIWRAGQHLALRIPLNDIEYRRSYSICVSSISGDPLQITVKRVEGGLISNTLNDFLKVGDTIEVMPPYGGFCLDPGPMLRRTHYFFAAGSGITPIRAMISSVLLAEPYSVCHLVYGNANHETILFREEFDEWAATYPDRFTVQHVLSKPSFWSRFSHWRKGRIDQETVAAFLDDHPPYAQDTQYYVCGPNAMNRNVRSALMALDVPANRIHTESYGGEQTLDDGITGVAAEAVVHLDGTTSQIAIAADQTVLNAVLQAGLSPAYSCQAGVCGACQAKLTKGTVHMRARAALEDGAIAKGVVLTCQAVATSERLELTYD